MQDSGNNHSILPSQFIFLACLKRFVIVKITVAVFVPEPGMQKPKVRANDCFKKGCYYVSLRPEQGTFLRR